MHEDDDLRQDLLKLLESTMTEQDLFANLRGLLEDHGAVDKEDRPNTTHADTVRSMPFYPNSIRPAETDFIPFSWQPCWTATSQKMADQLPIGAQNSNYPVGTNPYLRVGEERGKQQ